MKVKTAIANVCVIINSVVLCLIIWPFALAVAFIDWVTGRTDDYDRK